MTSPSSLLDLLERQQGEILSESFEGLSRCRLARYEAAGADETRRRLARLYALLKDSVTERDLEPVLVYAREIARQRYTEGFDLQEVQSAINVLEEAVWRRVVREIPADGLAEALGLVSTVLGVCKDTMASSYVALATKRHAGSLDLTALFRGTQNRFYTNTTE
ncbi:MAG: hypothetical protein KJ062_08790 [Thermoanaerobaculia bacterium]|nr:hypothetical protein [Thermoanaerobaculia bacterium]